MLKWQHQTTPKLSYIVINDTTLKASMKRYNNHQQYKRITDIQDKETFEENPRESKEKQKSEIRTEF